VFKVSLSLPHFKLIKYCSGRAFESYLDWFIRGYKWTKSLGKYFAV